ncbi:MAG: alkaline phosphatase PhoX [Pseudomonadota bacterium]
MKLKSLSRAVMAALGVTILSISLTGCDDDSNSPSISAVEFVETAGAPTSAGDMSKTLATAKAVVTYSDGSKKEYPLSYNTLFSLQDKVGGNAYAAGQLFNHTMQPLMDANGQPMIVETPDGNSLLNVDGSLYLVTHLEYDWLLANGTEASGRAPMGMLLTGLNQATDGKLSVKSQRAIDFSSVGGTWINCAASQTPWNTHLGSEEDYDLQFNPLNSNYSTTVAGLKAMTELYFDNSRQANPYDYGFIPEVTVKKDGATSVAKHYSMGRGAWEMSKVMADGKTAYIGDDGAYTMMAMFVADKSGDLSAGTLYAARWNQTSDQGGGAANLGWYKLGKASDAEIRAIIDSGVTFNSIWDAVLPVTDASGAKTCNAGYTRIRAGSTSDECLTLKPGMEKAAAFLETRRYAAYLGATTEFTKMEAIASNARDKKAYMAMSRIESSMKSETAAPADHIKLPENKAGATYTLELAGSQKTANGGEIINSDYVATRMYVEAALLGKPISTDAYGNTADVNTIANTDNVFFSEKMRTLFIGEDSGMHVNNYVWAYNVDTRKLTRMLSSAAGAENTGLQILDNLNGHAYIMSNNQHWGDLPGSVPASLKADLQSRIDRFHAPVGYIGGLPGM